MKILQIIYTLGAGGAERFVVDLSNELVKKHELHLITFYNEDNLFANYLDINIKNKCIDSERGFNLKAILKIQKIINEIKPDIIHCHLSVILYLSPLAFLYPRIKFIHTIHSDAQREPGTKFQKYIRKLLYNLSLFKAVTISPSCHNSFVEYYKSNKAYMIYNGRANIEPSELFENCKIELYDILNETNELLFVHVARYNKLKNQEVLIKVFNRLIKENYKISLLIIGAGFDSTEGRALKKLATSSVYFLGSKANATDYMYFADAFCLPSIYEGMPISLIESFATGCVPICTPTNGAIDTIINGVNGYLSNGFSENDYYASLKSFINSKSMISRQSLKEVYTKNFTIEVCSQKYEDLFNEIIKKQL